MDFNILENIAAFSVLILYRESHCLLLLRDAGILSKAYFNSDVCELFNMVSLLFLDIYAD